MVKALARALEKGDIPMPDKKEIIGDLGGSITILGLRIPNGCKDYDDFVSKIRVEENTFISQLSYASPP